jgi:hypothetical protein
MYNEKHRDHVPRVTLQRAPVTKDHHGLHEMPLRFVQSVLAVDKVQR